MHPLRNFSDSSQTNILPIQGSSTLAAMAEIASALFEDIQKQSAEPSRSPPLKKRKVEPKIAQEKSNEPLADLVKSAQKRPRKGSLEQKNESTSIGTIVYPEDSPYKYYRGSLFHGQPEGPGTLIFANGNSFEGPFRNGKRDDGYGTFTQTNGIILKGEWKNQQLHGLATISHPNGKTVEGRFIEGVLPKGTISYPENSLAKQYEGSLENLKAHGLGTLFFSNGAIFTGKFENTKIKGPGKLVYDTGIIIRGTWDDLNEISGQPIISYPEGYRIECYFKENAPFEGKIIYSERFLQKSHQQFLRGNMLLKKTVWPTSSIFDAIPMIGWADNFNKSFEACAFIKDAYSIKKTPAGDLQMDPLTESSMIKFFVAGQLFVGKISYPKGSLYASYMGCLLKGLPCGSGKMFFVNGATDEGTFANGVLHGEGKRITQEGKCYIGKWDNGEFIEGTCVLPNGECLPGSFENGTYTPEVVLQKLSPYTSAIF